MIKSIHINMKYLIYPNISYIFYMHIILQLTIIKCLKTY